MRRAIRLAALALALSLGNPVAADQFADATAAYNSGDYATALKLIRPLAERGDAAAQGNLGTLYVLGKGVPQDFAQAVKWFRKAADKGNAHAQAKLGVTYAKGEGVPRNYVLAHMWWSLAAAAGDKEAAQARDFVAAKMTPEQIAEARKLAREWKPKTGEEPKAQLP